MICSKRPQADIYWTLMSIFLSPKGLSLFLLSLFFPLHNCTGRLSSSSSSSLQTWGINWVEIFFQRAEWCGSGEPVCTRCYIIHLQQVRTEQIWTPFKYDTSWLSHSLTHTHITHLCTSPFWPAASPKNHPLYLPVPGFWHRLPVCTRCSWRREISAEKQRNLGQILILYFYSCSFVKIKMLFLMPVGKCVDVHAIDLMQGHL